MGEIPLSELIWVPIAAELEKEQGWIRGKVAEIGEEALQNLVASAVRARESAYPPYSGYQVGAAVLCESGVVYQGWNTEVVTYSETGHAEGMAVANATVEIPKSGRKFIEAVAVSHSGESGPCGACRQRIAQHCDNALILDVNGEGTIQRVTSLKTLLPYAFTPSHLE